MSCLSRAAAGTDCMWPCALPSAGTEPPFSSPRLCLRPPFLHFHFYFAADPPCSLHPLLCPARLPEQTSCHELREEPACLGLTAAFGGGQDTAAAALVPGVPRDVGVEAGCRARHWGWILALGSCWDLVAASSSACAPLSSGSLSSRVRGVPACLVPMQGSGLASAATPRWLRALGAR